MSQHAVKNKNRIRVNNKIIAAFIVTLAYFLFYLFTANAVLIKLQPMDAEISIRGGGFPHFKIGGRYLLRKGNYRLNISHPGHYSLFETIEVNEDPSQNFVFDLKRLPGKLVIRTNPESKITLKVDDTVFDPSQNGEFIISAGEHALEILTERYFAVEQDILIQGMEIQQEMEIGLIPAWAEISVATSPIKANILIDGQLTGTTPDTIEILEGEYVMLLTKKGFKPFEQRLEVKASQSQVIDDIKLSKLDSTLKVITKPTDAAININGIYRGLSPVVIDLPPEKTHLLEISKPGYKSMSKEIILDTREAMESAQIDFIEFQRTLEPLMGSVNITGTRKAAIFSDDKQIASIPASIQLLAKEQTLTVKKEGLVTQKINVKPTPGFEQTIEVRLLTPEESVLAAMPKTISTSQGLKMRLVPTGTFMMGAPRRDQGRRANETERLVEITKPFYVGMREIINKEFRQFKPRHTSGAETFRELSNGLHPSVMVTWSEAVAFCNWLSNKESLEPAYDKLDGQLVLKQPVTNGYRLLTEAEWEWLARYNGGAGKQRYPWGQSMPPEEQSGNFADESTESLVANVLTDYWDGYPVTSPAGKFNPNLLGVYDLGGNVAEWVNDYYSVYLENLKKIDSDPLGPEEGTARVIRGSSWRHSSISSLRFSYRDYGTQGRLDVGFRIARYTDNSFDE